MTRDLIFSVALHVGVVALTLLASPFESKSQIDYDDVIRVDLVWGVDEEPVTPEPAVLASEPPPEPVEPITQTTVEEEAVVEEPEATDEVVVDEDPEPAEEPEQNPPPIQPEVEPTVKPTVTDKAVEEGPREIHSPATAGSSLFAGATINNAGFDYPYWFTQAFNKVRRNWRNPVMSDAAIVCAVYFEVIKSGKIIVARIETSSGIPAFDEACLRAVNGAAPFPPLPREFADEIIGITLPFKGISGR